jgi:hypothetical protein
VQAGGRILRPGKTKFWKLWGEGGLYDGLKSACYFHSLMMATDMPYLNQSELNYIDETESDKFDPVHFHLFNI